MDPAGPGLHVGSARWWKSKNACRHVVYYVYMTYLTRCHVVIERPRSWTASDGLHLHYSWREVRYVLAQQHRCSLVLVGTVPQVHV